MGCNGGLMDNAFNYATTHALEQESEYPYTGRDGTCVDPTGTGSVKITSWVDVATNSPTALLQAVA